MNIPKSFPAKGWRRVRVGSPIKKGDVWQLCSASGAKLKPFVDVPSVTEVELVISVPLYRKIKAKKTNKRK